MDHHFSNIEPIEQNDVELVCRAFVRWLDTRVVLAPRSGFPALDADQLAERFIEEMKSTKVVRIREPIGE